MQAVQRSLQNPVQKTSSSNSLTVSDAGIAKALKYLTSNEKPTKHTPLLPAHVCDAVIARYSDIGPAIQESDARKATVLLLAGYPSAFNADQSERLPYMTKIMGVFCQYPECAVKKVIAPGFTFAGNPSFRPNDKEVKEALDLIIQEHRAIAVRASWHKAEGERRAAEDAREAKIKAEQAALTPEKKAMRAAKIEAILANLRNSNQETVV